MTARQAFLAGVVFSLLTLLAVFVVDGAVAAMVAPHAQANRAALHGPVTALEIAFGFPLSKFATGAAIVLVGAVLFAAARHRHTGRLLLFVGVAHLVTRLIAGVLKNVFLRARPDEGTQWFIDGGSSFPSGHAAHFWALFFALAIAFPRLRIPALLLALFVAAARVAVHDHVVSDVVASGAIAAFVSGGCAMLMLARRAPAPPRAEAVAA